MMDNRRSPAARSRGAEPGGPGGGALAAAAGPAAPAPDAAPPQGIDFASTPFTATIAGYKQRCSELEEEVAAGLAAATAQRVEADALRTKVDMLTECCRALDAQLAELRRRAALAAAEPAAPPTLPPAPTESRASAPPPCMAPELAKLLRAACRQLEEARRVGSRLQGRLGSGPGGGKHGFTCA